VFEGEVDGGAEHGGREDDGADLELEGAAVPGILAEEDAADISCFYVSVSLCPFFLPVCHPSSLLRRLSFRSFHVLCFAKRAPFANPLLSLGVSPNSPAVSRINPSVMAAVNVHVLLRIPIKTAAARQIPKATAKKMLAPKLGV
jgi:hypothetical protein